jgi:hypothetical protein
MRERSQCLCLRFGDLRIYLRPVLTSSSNSGMASPSLALAVSRMSLLPITTLLGSNPTAQIKA